MPIKLLEKVEVYFTNIWFLWAVCLIFNIITFLFIYFKIHPGNKILALHYNVLAGVEWYGKGISLYLLPAAALGISLANFTLFRAVGDSKALLKYLCIFISPSGHRHRRFVGDADCGPGGRSRDLFRIQERLWTDGRHRSRLRCHDAIRAYVSALGSRGRED